jgi:hypothetical protein
MAVMPHVRFLSRFELPASPLINPIQILTAAPANAVRCGDLLYLLRSETEDFNV